MGSGLNVLDYFSSIGFPCPWLENPADHCRIVTRKKRRKDGYQWCGNRSNRRGTCLTNLKHRNQPWKREAIFTLFRDEELLRRKSQVYEPLAVWITRSHVKLLLPLSTVLLFSVMDSNRATITTFPQEKTVLSVSTKTATTGCWLLRFQESRSHCCFN